MTVVDPNPILFENASEAILLLNRDGQILNVNREACRTLSLPEARLLEKPVLAMVVPEDRDRVKKLFLRVLGGQEREWIARFKRGDGVTRVQWVRAVPVGDDGGVERIVMFSRDVTESRAGRPETLQLQTLLENLPGQLVTVVDPAGRVRYSSGMSRTHFRDDVDALGTLYEELLDPGEENERLLSEMLHETSDGRDWAGTHWHRRVDGTVFSMRTYASPYRDPRSGTVLGVLLVARDVTPEYDWRERALRAERLAGVGSLVAGVAERLTDAVHHVEAALASGAADDPLLGAVSVPRELSRMKGLTGALADFAGSATPVRKRIFLPDEAHEVLAGMAPRLDRRGVRVVVEVPEELPTVHADPGQARQVLRILLENAAESGDGDRPPEVRLAFAATSDGVQVRVQDDGGVDPEVLHRFFEPFFTTKDGRAGLGLAMVRATLQAHGGTAAVAAREDGPGTEVVVEFPREAPQSTLRFRPTPLSLSRHRSVLVVDDESAVRHSIRKFLETVGFQVREAWSGRSALAQITVDTPPELVLTDLKMSDGSGSWFLEQLSRDFPDLLRRTVIVTGDTDQAEISRLTRETGCPVMRKPLEMPQLLDVLDEVAAR
jgi:PAS domain S-box-containing protein